MTAHPSLTETSMLYQGENHNGSCDVVTLGKKSSLRSNLAMSVLDREDDLAAVDPVS